MIHTLPNLSDHLGKSKHKTRKRLPSLPGAAVSLPPIPNLSDEPAQAVYADAELNLLIAELGDEGLARRVLKLRAKYYKTTSGTIPELIVMDWLDRKGYKYEFQKWLLGGRAIHGGQVVDFAVDMGVRVVVIEVQGTYYHTMPGKEQFDEAERLALASITIWGKPVVLVELWDTKLITTIKQRRENALQMAVSGTEVGR